METFLYNFGWLLLLGLIVFVVLYKKATKNPDAVTSRFYTQKIIESDDHLTDRIIAALNRAGFSNAYYDEADGTIYARSPMTMSSWGESIVIEVLHEGSQAKIRFKSICAFPYQLFDWGKNKRNFNKFWRAFEMSLQAT